ncbi:vesicle transport protein Sec20 isoform X1 [Bombus vancouverensis nearcticus]|uniref:Vesicle transport protein SEC20 isoform X1 n=2 Tax=Pyrobombus TaxID=144703 RepID=A0A6P3DWD6_BOMIM|nr:vesicle transport protein SEC20 isoform X1 [Bombus impatiens]XP_024223741.1 vesicle transport protein SEC20 isoform X1 [Bombus impatiens]XP_033190673.1 vesicle transport protein SEC20 [Bombus vancouverensis nearcticus]XP_033190684.1 vesicle transport protein SEC20 [Bombus vancouverensis nearcticus]XP_033310348.1 vesicle transport protein SEC20 [Bombus bifarius]XP_050481958.1 vesicle transport protein SEC20 isoform X1 [Bombus huntii]XP_050481959.1 vesicle transport protein SEC20 isoform X1 
MDTEHHAIEFIRQDIVKNHLQVTAVIQDIQQCIGPLELLNKLNAEGRANIAALKSCIDKLISLAERESSEKKKVELLAEVDTYRQQLNTSLAAFRKANVVSVCVIDKLAKKELLSMSKEQQEMLSIPEEEQAAIRRRHDKRNLANTSSQLSDKLLSISRHLAETTQKSADTLDTLIISSDKVTTTKDELEHQQQVIVQSGKLLGKYGRREVTDKALVTLAFAFFLACVFYILQKRIF